MNDAECGVNAVKKRGLVAVRKEGKFGVRVSYDKLWKWNDDLGRSLGRVVLGPLYLRIVFTHSSKWISRLRVFVLIYIIVFATRAFPHIIGLTDKL